MKPVYFATTVIIMVVVAAFCTTINAAESTSAQRVGAPVASMPKQGENKAAEGLTSREIAGLPPYIRMTTDSLGRLTPMPDSLFNSVAASTIFKVNRTELNRRDPLLRHLADSVLTMIDDSTWVFYGIELRGAASPEGPYNNNVRLSRGRAKALIDFIAEQKPGIEVADIEVSTTAEDYARLLWMLKDAGDPASTAVEAIINVCGLDNPAAIKARLQRYDGGRLWRRLLVEYFPALRAARFVIYFRPVLHHPEFVPVQTTAVKAETRTPHPLAVAGSISKPLPRPHMLSVSTNLLYDAFYMPKYGMAPMVNLGLEYFFPHSRYTIKAAFTFPYYLRWNRQQFFQIRDYHLEARRYFKLNRWHTGAYMGLYANATKYGIGLSATQGWQGEGIGGALKVGYVVPLGKGRWRMDFHVAAGGFYTCYDPYVFGNPITGEIDGKYYYNYTGPVADFNRRAHKLLWLGPTEVGITLSYDLLFYKLRGHGASFRGKEVLRR